MKRYKIITLAIFVMYCINLSITSFVIQNYSPQFTYFFTLGLFVAVILNGEATRKRRISYTYFIAAHSIYNYIIIALFILFASLALLEGLFSSQNFIGTTLVNSSYLVSVFVFVSVDLRYNKFGGFLSRLRNFHYNLIDGNLGQALNLVGYVKSFFHKEGLNIQNGDKFEESINKRICSYMLKKNQIPPQENPVEIYPTLLETLKDKQKITFGNIYAAITLPSIIVKKSSTKSSILRLSENIGKILAIFSPTVVLSIINFFLTGQIS